MIRENGIFISYRHSYSDYAGRIYDELKRRGLSPFMDVYQMSQGNFHTEIGDKIRDCPYFLLILYPGCLDGLREDDVFFREIRTALECKEPSELLIAAHQGFVFPSAEQLPEALRGLSQHHYDYVTHELFGEGIDRLVRNIRPERIGRTVNWREYIACNASTAVMSREEIEHRYATMENRFGAELVTAVREGRRYEGPRTVKRICMSCYAASLLFNPGREMVDDRAFDNGLLFNLFAELLRDPDFFLEIIINAPGSEGAQEAIRNKMLGNKALEDYPEAVFLGAYAGLCRLIEEDPVFMQAYRERRFRFYLTDAVMTGAIFRTEYKEPMSEFDHIKFDVYSFNIDSNMSRRCMLFFRADNAENYDYFCRTYEYIRNHRLSQKEVREKHDGWIAEWDRVREEL